jgi:hypothetical protein
MAEGQRRPGLMLARSHLTEAIFDRAQRFQPGSANAMLFRAGEREHRPPAWIALGKPRDLIGHATQTREIAGTRVCLRFGEQVAALQHLTAAALDAQALEPRKQLIAGRDVGVIERVQAA